MENGEVQEFFIAGENYCVNVLAFEKPDVTESIR
ncbi:hypothetical protein MSL71_28240 [Desulfoluna butyratoxydans]|uniref:Uncharacterized protein n=2 Tax=Desulfoluna butyratoxydans TaxID=231438 RepID=A0A4U8YP01_9BACT|nr:hypothetical protein MSL71_28240 [Desulfoluna butyratoxydans]